MFNRKSFIFLIAAMLLAGLLFLPQIVGRRSQKRHSLFQPRGPLPTPPVWMKDVPAKPDWWESVSANYDESMTKSNKVERQKDMDRAISKKVVGGKSPVTERRQLIKYVLSRAAAPETTDNERQALMEIAAHNYENLGDYKTAAKINADEVEKTDGMSLYTLAFDYERTGEKDAALQVYNYMAASFEGGGKDSGNIGYWLGSTGARRLSGVTNECVLKKPDWWSQYDNQPAWWADEAVTLPELTCFSDGLTYITHAWAKKEPKKAAKAFTLLSESKPMTAIDRITAATWIGMAYAEMGDHQRAIISQWKIPEHLAGGPFESTNALKSIAREFDKLGDTNKAAEMRAAMGCFAKGK